MLLLKSTDILRLVTGAAGDIDVVVSWVDKISDTSFTPDRSLNATIATATTTTIAGSPSSGVVRNITGVSIENASATVSNTVTVQLFDGTNNADLISITLLPGENLYFTEEGAWVHHDSNGAEYPATTLIDPWNVYGIAGTLAETIPRSIAGVNVAALTSGTLYLQAVYLRAGQKVTNISFCSGTTAAGTPTNRRFALYSSARALLAQTADQTTTAWAANTVMTTALTAAYTVPTTGLYYVGIMVAATTVPSLAGITAAGNAALRTTAPIISGNSTAALTTTLPDPAAAITAGVNSVWAALT